MCQEGKLFRGNVTATSLTASDLGTPGEYRIESDGNKYKLYRSGTTLAINTPVQKDSASISETNFVVENLYTSNVPLAGFWTQQLTLASDVYFFGLIRGTMSMNGLYIEAAAPGLTKGCALVFGMNTKNVVQQLTSQSSNIIAPMVIGQHLDSDDRASNLGSQTDATDQAQVFVNLQGA